VTARIEDERYSCCLGRVVPSGSTSTLSYQGRCPLHGGLAFFVLDALAVRPCADQRPAPDRSGR
jgi:hypothetical protein